MEKMIKHDSLKFLNDFMYNMGYDMGKFTDIVELRYKIIKVSDTIKKLLELSPEEFKQTIEEFNKEHCENVKTFWENVDRELNSRDLEDEYED